MSDVTCPICLGQCFTDFRGREYAQCMDCSSLERHRLFKLFLAWLTPVRSRLLLSTPGPLTKIDRFQQGMSVERLEKLDPSSLSKADGHDTLVFLDNMVGFEEIEEDCIRRVRALMEVGSLIAFTVHSGFEQKRQTELFELFGRDVECQHFDPRAIYAENVSDRFGLNLGTRRYGRGDIHFWVPS